MCGRIALYAETGQIAQMFDIDPGSVPQLAPNRNIAPSNRVLACYRGTRMSTVRWGIPSRYGDRPIINARSETAHSKPTFAQAFDNARCLIPVNGFYEWQAVGTSRKQPFWITRTDDQPFALAGLIVLNPRPALVIMTTEPNSLVKPIHKRMPIIVDPDSFDDWFTQPAHSKQIRAITTTRPWDDMQAITVSMLVNDPLCNSAELIATTRTQHTINPPQVHEK